MIAINEYPFGTNVTVRVEFSIDRTLVDPSIVTLTIVEPGDVSTTYTYGVGTTIVKTDVGKYYARIPFRIEGIWYYGFRGIGIDDVSNELPIRILPSNVYTS